MSAVYLGVVLEGDMPIVVGGGCPLAFLHENRTRLFARFCFFFLNLGLQG